MKTVINPWTEIEEMQERARVLLNSIKEFDKNGQHVEEAECINQMKELMAEIQVKIDLAKTAAENAVLKAWENLLNFCLSR